MAEVDSSTGGTLAPAGTPAPEEDADLDALFQRTVSEITGLPGSLVRPRWQADNPKQPEANVNWCAIGVTDSEPDAGPAITHVSAGLGSANYARHESISVLATFYGPSGSGLASRLRDGLAVPQNMEMLRAHKIGLVECGPTRSFPEFVNQQWIKRYDMQIRFRRKVSRVYAVRNILAADIHVIDDTHVDETIHVPPAR